MSGRILIACSLMMACSADTSGPSESGGEGTPDVVADVGGGTPDTAIAPTDTGSTTQDANLSDAGPSDTGVSDSVATPDIVNPDPPEDVPPPPEEPTLIQPNTTWEVTSTLVMEGDYTFAWDPTGEQLILQGGDGAVYFSPPGQITPPLEVDPGDLRDGALMYDGDVPVPVVAADEGLFVRVDEELVRSPIDDILPSAPLDLLASQSPVFGWLWMALEEGLWVYHDGGVYAVQPDGIGVGGAHLAFGAPVDGFPSLWGVNESGTWALSPSDGALTLTATREALTGVSIASDGEEHLWVVDDAGDLHERAPNGAWEWWRLPSPVTQVTSGGETEGIWLVVGGELWFHHGLGYGPLETALSGTFLGVDAKGRALVAVEEGVWAIALTDLTTAVIEDPPTWSGDIESISDENCGACHGQGAYAHPIYEPEHWIAEIDQILFMVTEPAWEPQMPLPPNPPLDTEAVQAIMDWRDAGFP